MIQEDEVDHGRRDAKDSASRDASSDGSVWGVGNAPGVGIGAHPVNLRRELLDVLVRRRGTALQGLHHPVPNLVGGGESLVPQSLPSQGARSGQNLINKRQRQRRS